MEKSCLKIAINGFGRIGRNVLRAFLQYADDYQGLNIVAINDVADAEVLLHLLKFDSTHGRLSFLGVQATLVVRAGLTYLKLVYHDQIKEIALLQCAKPDNLPWQALGVDVVLECTGQFRSYTQANLHKQAGAKQVIIGAAPFDEVDASIVMGVNDEILDGTQTIISGVSCTTQALVPLLWALDRQFGLKSAMMTEIHAVTADQTVLDQAHRDWRRARASGHNIIPTTSSSIAATLKVLPQMTGKLNGHSIRVPTINVAAIDVNVQLQQKTHVQAVSEYLQAVSQTSLSGIMDYSHEPLVSSDFIHDRHSLIIDGGQMMMAGEQLKIFAWYDNEWGYANRLLDICRRLKDCRQNVST